MIGSSTSTKWFFVYLNPGRIGIWKFWFLRRGGNRSTWRKTSWERTNNKLNPNMASMWEFEPRPHIGGRRPFSPLYHPLLLLPCFSILLYMYKYMKYYLIYLLWFNFVLGLSFIFLLFQIHYLTLSYQNTKKNKI